jgi:hypothetical protein
LEFSFLFLPQVLVCGNGRISRNSIEEGRGKVALGGRDSDIKSNFGEGARGAIVDGWIGIRTEGNIEWATVGDGWDDVLGFGGEAGGRMNDLGCFENVGENGDKAVTDAIVTPPFGYFLAVEDVMAFGVDGGAADACGKIGRSVDVKMELALEGDGEEVAWDAVGLVAAAHCDERVGRRRDE